MQVVGVAQDVEVPESCGDAEAVLLRADAPEYAMGQNLDIRTSLGPEAMAKALVREIHALDANLAPGEVITMQEQVDRTTAVQRVGGDDARRVRRIGAGAGRHRTVRRDVVHGVAEHAGTGAADGAGRRRIGSVAAGDVARPRVDGGRHCAGRGRRAELTRLMGNLLYKVSPRDPLAFGSAFVVMAIASLAACFLPAWRATRTDPVRALRE